MAVLVSIVPNVGFLRYHQCNATFLKIIYCSFAFLQGQASKCWENGNIPRTSSLEEKKELGRGFLVCWRDHPQHIKISCKLMRSPLDVLCLHIVFKFQLIHCFVKCTWLLPILIKSFVIASQWTSVAKNDWCGKANFGLRLMFELTKCQCSLL